MVWSKVNQIWFFKTKRLQMNVKILIKKYFISYLMALVCSKSINMQLRACQISQFSSCLWKPQLHREWPSVQWKENPIQISFFVTPAIAIKNLVHSKFKIKCKREAHYIRIPDKNTPNKNQDLNQTKFMCKISIFKNWLKVLTIHNDEDQRVRLI